MRHRSHPLILLLITVLGLSLAGPLTSPLAAAEPPSLFARENLVAWCIVPFDSKKRGPEARAEMVKGLGLKRIAYDWREEHVPTFEAEILAYQKHGLDFFAFWGQHDQAFRLFEQYQLHPQIWQTMGGGNGATHEERVHLAATAMTGLIERTRKAGCRLAIYNHGGWGGEPENMAAVCDYLRKNQQADHVGIVYNLHHGHGHVDDFAAALARMKPYLWCLNLNGMTRDGDKNGKKILPLGQGELDLGLLHIVRDSGYQGRIGILGHTMNDAEDQLRDNLDGLDWLVPQLDGAAPGPKPSPRTLRQAK